MKLLLSAVDEPLNPAKPEDNWLTKNANEGTHYLTLKPTDAGKTIVVGLPSQTTPPLAKGDKVTVMSAKTAWTRYAEPTEHTVVSVMSQPQLVQFGGMMTPARYPFYIGLPVTDPAKP
jgi:hypothetical protein